jgi:hypothetical protein
LRHLEGLHNNPLLLLIVPDLGVSGHGEVLPQRVAIETVVGHDAPQIRVSDEEDTKEIVHFALVPVGTIVEIAQTGNRSSLIRVCLDPQARVVTDAKHVVNDLEALVLGGVVDGCDVGDLGVFGRSVVLEEGEGRDDARRRNVDGQFILPYGESGVASDGGSGEGHGIYDALLNVFWQT